MLDSLLFLAADPVAAEGGNVVGDIAGRFGVEWPILFAQILNFIVLAVVLWFFAFKPVMRTIDDRQQKISDGLQYAEEMKRKLEDAEREHAAKLKEASVEAQRLMEQAKENARSFEERQRQEATQTAEGIVAKAREATEREHENMLAQLRGEVAELVVRTTQKVLGKELSPEERSTFSNSAASEIAGRN